MASVTVAEILEMARIRHPSFTEKVMPDGALLMELRQVIRTLLLDNARALAPLVGTSTDIAPAGDPVTFPLPADFIAVASALLLHQAGTFEPVSIVPEHTIAEYPQTRDLAAFVRGGVIIPIRDRWSDPTDDAWENVYRLRLTYIANPAIAGLAATVIVPDAVLTAVIAQLAALMAEASREVTERGKERFAQRAAAASAAIAASVGNIVGDATDGNVIFTG